MRACVFRIVVGSLLKTAYMNACACARSCSLVRWTHPTQPQTTNQPTQPQSRYKGPPQLSSLLAYLSAQTGQLPRAAPGYVPISSVPAESLLLESEDDEDWPLLLPPPPLVPPRLGLLYWLAWAFLLSRALGPRAAESWRRKRKGCSGGGASSSSSSSTERSAPALGDAAAAVHQ